MFKNNKNKISNLHNRFHHADNLLIIIVLVILVFGLISLLSASSVYSYNRYNDAYYLFKHQLFGLILGIAAFIILARTDYHIWKNYALGFLVFSMVLLILVFIPGLSATYGKARSWINLFGFSLQPSELVKLSFLLYLAAWLENKKESLHEFSSGYAPFLIILAIIAFLMILQPDIGTLSIIAITSMIVYFIGGARLRFILLATIGGLAVVTIMVLIKPYQLDRIRCVINPDFDKTDKCYQINQSLIAVGSGGIFGRGLGESRQKYMYLPEVQGDSIFAIIAEEIGLVGGSILLLLYIIMFYRGYLIAKYAPDDFGRILAVGIVSWLAIQTIINIGGIINLIPMTGVPLPLISYGGTAILATLMAFGVLVNISKQTRSYTTKY